MPLDRRFTLLQDPVNFEDRVLQKKVRQFPTTVTLGYFIGGGFMALGALQYLFRSRFEILMSGPGYLWFFGLMILLITRNGELVYEELARRNPASVAPDKKALSSGTRTILRWVIIVSFFAFLAKYSVLPLTG